MTGLFVNHSVNKIDLAAPWCSLLIIFLIILLLSAVSIQKRDIAFLDLGSSLVFRGVAILLLLCGHFAQMCLVHEGNYPVDGGFLAVCIFLFLSGYGLIQRYGFEKISGKFWPRRLLRLFVPLWLTLTLFILLDQFLLGLSHPLWEIVLNYSGIMFNGAFVRVNSPAWFVDYILLQYILFFLFFRSGLGIYTKIASLFTASVIVAFAIYTTFLFDYFSIWLQYTLVFPIGILIALLLRDSRRWKRYLPVYNAWYISLALFILSAAAIIVVGEFLQKIGHHPKLFLQQLFLIIGVISGGSMLAALGRESKFLLLLGKYSYEIFLLHLPFMVKYDFILFHKPFMVSCIVYFVLIVVLAMGVQKLSNAVQGVIEAKYAF